MLVTLSEAFYEMVNNENNKNKSIEENSEDYNEYQSIENQLKEKVGTQKFVR